MEENNIQKKNNILVICVLFLSVIAFLAVMKVTPAFSIPLFISFFVSLIFEPVISFLHRRCKIPWWLCVILMVGLTAVIISLIGGLLVAALKKIAELYPKYEERFLSIYESVAKLFKFQFNEEYSLFENLWSHLQVREFVKNLALSLSQGVIQFFRNFLIICLYTVFFLLEMRVFRAKFINAFDKSSKGRIGNIISGIITEVSQYMSIKFYISLATGVLIWFGCMVIGIDFAIIWGFLAFIANFIPTFGSIVSCFVTILFSVLQFWPHPARIIATAVFMISVNMIIGNIVEPRIQGRELDLSPFIILVSLTLWGYIWGFIGMIVAVPLMVIVKIICENISSLKPFAILLGSDAN